MAQYSTIWLNIAQYGTIWHNMAQYSTIWLSIAQYGTIWHNHVYVHVQHNDLCVSCEYMKTNLSQRASILAHTYVYDTEVPQAHTSLSTTTTCLRWYSTCDFAIPPLTSANCNNHLHHQPAAQDQQRCCWSARCNIHCNLHKGTQLEFLPSADHHALQQHLCWSWAGQWWWWLELHIVAAFRLDLRQCWFWPLHLVPWPLHLVLGVVVTGCGSSVSPLSAISQQFLCMCMPSFCLLSVFVDVACMNCCAVGACIYWYM